MLRRRRDDGDVLALQVARGAPIELMNGPALDPRQFDRMMEPILTEPAHCIVDTGTSSFVAVSEYIIQNDVHQVIADAGKQVCVHAIVVGGSTLVETLHDLDALVKNLPSEIHIVVWVNANDGRRADV